VTFSANDTTGTLVAAINRITDQTGVTASIVEGGKLQLSSEDGRDIVLSSDAAGTTALTAAEQQPFGFSDGTTSSVTLNGTSGTLALESKGVITLESDTALVGLEGTYSVGNSISTADVTTYDAAQLTIKKADHALAQLDRTRSDIGSVQNQLESTIRNISVTQVNVTAAESQIRDVDFAQESANFSKYNILAQSGSYALSQANAVQQNVLSWASIPAFHFFAKINAYFRQPNRFCCGRMLSYQIQIKRERNSCSSPYLKRCFAPFVASRKA